MDSAAFRMRTAAGGDIAVGDPVEPAIEPAEECAQRSPRRLARPQQQGRQRRAQRQRIERRDDDRDRDRHRELLVSRPVIPGMNAVGTKTATRISAMAMTGPETSSIALKRRVARRQPVLDVVLDGLDHHDRVVDHQADGEHEPEQRQRVDREPEQREDGERPDQGDGHGQQRNQRRPPALQEEEHHEDHEHQRLEQRVDDLVDAFA